ncbi:MAG: glucosamine-6-phosphate deaminase [Aerococcus sp.]|nr:glucosamine-6-phosphate deaminase [Aerococcus sp.]
MEIKTFKTKEEASQAAFQEFQALVDEGGGVFGLATGSTPILLYDLLTQADSIDFSNSESINLDEYRGLAADHPQSYSYFMHQHLFNKKPFRHSYLLDGTNSNAEEETSHFEEIIQAHPIDLQLLGLGMNGHIGFNEPGSSFDSRTRVVDLTASTIDANKRFFASEEDVPRQAYSMGIGSILSAKKIVLMAFGENKADAVYKMVHGPKTEEVPASALQSHDDVVVLLDEGAASLL